VSSSTQSADAGDTPFLERHQFLIYRLFSLSGLLPVGAFLVVHLLTNASVLAGPGVFQSRVDLIHSLGPLLPVVEWAFIFLPMIFHASVGIAIIAGGLPNVGSYTYSGNIRYTLQRVTGMIAFAFIIWHIWQLHAMGKPLGGGAFDPHHAASTASEALRPMVVAVLTQSVCSRRSTTFPMGSGRLESPGASGPVRPPCRGPTGSASPWEWPLVLLVSVDLAGCVQSMLRKRR